MSESRRSFRYDEKTIQYWSDAPPIEGDGNGRESIEGLEEAEWYFEVDGTEHHLGPWSGESPDEIETRIRIAYLRGPGVSRPGVERPMYSLKEGTPLDPTTLAPWLRLGEAYRGRPLEETRSQTGEVEIRLFPPDDAEEAASVIVGSPYLVRLPPGGSEG